MSSPDSLSDSPASTTCFNCNTTNAGIILGINDRKPDDKGKQYNPFSTNIPKFIPKNVSLAFNLKKRIVESKKNKKDKFRVKDVYVSEEVKQCTDPNEMKNITREKEKIVDDYDEEEIGVSCRSLAIDG